MTIPTRVVMPPVRADRARFALDLHGYSPGHPIRHDLAGYPPDAPIGDDLAVQVQAMCPDLDLTACGGRPVVVRRSIDQYRKNKPGTRRMAQVGRLIGQLDAHMALVADLADAHTGTLARPHSASRTYQASQIRVPESVGTDGPAIAEHIAAHPNLDRVLRYLVVTAPWPVWGCQHDHHAGQQDRLVALAREAVTFLPEVAGATLPDGRVVLLPVQVSAGTGTAVRRAWLYGFAQAMIDQVVLPKTRKVWHTANLMALWWLANTPDMLDTVIQKAPAFGQAFSGEGQLGVSLAVGVMARTTGLVPERVAKTVGVTVCAEVVRDMVGRDPGVVEPERAGVLKTLVGSTVVRRAVRGLETDGRVPEQREMGRIGLGRHHVARLLSRPAVPAVARTRAQGQLRQPQPGLGLSSVQALWRHLVVESLSVMATQLVDEPIPGVDEAVLQVLPGGRVRVGRGVARWLDALLVTAPVDTWGPGAQVGSALLREEASVTALALPSGRAVLIPQTAGLPLAHWYRGLAAAMVLASWPHTGDEPGGVPVARVAAWLIRESGWERTYGAAWFTRQATQATPTRVAPNGVAPGMVDTWSAVTGWPGWVFTRLYTPPG